METLGLMEISGDEKNEKPESSLHVFYLTNAESDVTEGWSVEILLKQQ